MGAGGSGQENATETRRGDGSHRARDCTNAKATALTSNSRDCSHDGNCYADPGRAERSRWRRRGGSVARAVNFTCEPRSGDLERCDLVKIVYREKEEEKEEEEEEEGSDLVSPSISLQIVNKQPAAVVVINYRSILYNPEAHSHQALYIIQQKGILTLYQSKREGGKKVILPTKPHNRTSPRVKKSPYRTSILTA